MNTIEEEFKRLPKELKHLIIEESLSTKPFTEEDIDQLLGQINTNEMAVFYGNDKYCKMIGYTRSLNEQSSASNIYWLSFLINHQLMYERSPYPISLSKEDITKYLIDRIDFTIIKTLDSESVSTEFDIDYTNDELDELETTYLKANIILLDIKSMYSVLLNRFNTAGVISSKEKAVTAIQRFLDNMIDYYAPLDDDKKIISHNPKIFSLLVYLAISAELLGLIKANDYVGFTSRGIINDGHFQSVTNRCIKLYDIIHNMFDSFKAIV